MEQDSPRSLRRTTRLWVVVDALIIVVAAIIATLAKKHVGPLHGAKMFWEGTLIDGRSMWTLLALLCWFGFWLIYFSHKEHLYTPSRLGGYLHEQLLVVQVSLLSGLLLPATLYFLRAQDIPRRIVFITLVLVTICISLRRIAYRIYIHNCLKRNIGTCNIFIVGTGSLAKAMRRYIARTPHLGYIFKGFIGRSEHSDNGEGASTEVVGPYHSLFPLASRSFIQEIFITAPCERETIEEILMRAQEEHLSVRLVSYVDDGFTMNNPIEYIGQIPTVLLYNGQVEDAGQTVKRVFDIVFSIATLLILSPLFLLVAIAIKLDSPGPVFYCSDRIGKKGRYFRCVKFRTMVGDAESRKAELMHMNERDGVLFKIAKDPRITRVGRWLRKYSVDELPQFWNALCGDMSIVGPRPPLASELQEYDHIHLRRLDVIPGITGLWQVQARSDPSFDSYFLLDMAYINNWSIWLDMKLIARTVGVVIAGTGS
jgi:exopolysaccharide biosynthesis polyprenyl glycosylphosphotransferase